MQPDLSLLKAQIIDAGSPTRSLGSKRDINEHFAMLEKEFSGQSALLFHHAKLVVLARRKIDIDETAFEFMRLWAKETDFLCSGLNLRWLVSACDTFADHGANAAQRGLGMAATILVNVVKLYETERKMAGLDAAGDHRTLELQTPLFDGLTCFRIGRGDMVANLVRRMKAFCELDPVAGALLAEVFNRLNEENTVFRRFLAKNELPRTGWGRIVPNRVTE